MKMRKLKLGLASLAAVAVLAGCSSATASGGGVTIDGSTVTIDSEGEELDRDPAGRRVGRHSLRQPVRDRHGFRPGRRTVRCGSTEQPARQVTSVNAGSLMA